MVRRNVQDSLPRLNDLGPDTGESSQAELRLEGSTGDIQGTQGMHDAPLSF
jgi:hypothetical protein